MPSWVRDSSEFDSPHPDTDYQHHHIGRPSGFTPKLCPNELEFISSPRWTPSPCQSILSPGDFPLCLSSPDHVKPATPVCTTQHGSQPQTEQDRLAACAYVRGERSRAPPQVRTRKILSPVPNVFWGEITFNQECLFFSHSVSLNKKHPAFGFIDDGGGILFV